MLGVRNHHGQGIAGVSGGRASCDEKGPVVNDQAVVADAGDVFSSEHALDTGRGQGLRGVDPQTRARGCSARTRAACSMPSTIEIGDEVLGAESLLATPVAWARGSDTGAQTHLGGSLEPVGLAEKAVGARRTTLEVAAVSPGLARGLDRVDDAVVAGAAADVAGQRPLDPWCGRPSGPC